MLKSIRFFGKKSHHDKGASAVPTVSRATVESRRRRQLKLRLSLQQRQTADFYYLIDIVGACNLRCPSCAVGNYVDQPTKGLMSLETYKLVLEKIAKDHPNEIVFIDLFNWGEPGLHKQLGRVIKLTKDFGFGVGISSNLNVFPDMKEAVSAQPSYIRISLSGYFNEIYQQTHKGGDINLVKANMHMLRYLIDKTGSDTIVQVGFHVYKSNFPENFRRMRELCHDLDFIFAPTLAALTPVEKAVLAVDGEVLPGHEALLGNLVVSTSERAALLSKVRSNYTDCQYRQKRTTINFDCSVPLCCATFEKEQIIAANFFEVSKHELMERKYAHGFCKECQKRSLDMVYTGVEPHLVDEKAVGLLGAEWSDFMKEWYVSLDPVVEWGGGELSVQSAFDTAKNLCMIGNAVAAKQLFAALLKVAPRHGEASFQLGRLLELEGNLKDALLRYKAAKAVWPDHGPYIDAVRDIEAKAD